MDVPLGRSSGPSRGGAHADLDHRGSMLGVLDLPPMAAGGHGPQPLHGRRYRHAQPACMASTLIMTTAIVWSSSSVGLNSTSRVPALNSGR